MNEALKEAKKALKKGDIDQNTGYLIMAVGYTYAGFQFPFDTYSQTNFSGLSVEVLAGVITSADFPLDIWRYNQAGDSSIIAQSNMRTRHSVVSLYSGY